MFAFLEHMEVWTREPSPNFPNNSLYSPNFRTAARYPVKESHSHKFINDSRPRVMNSAGVAKCWNCRSGFRATHTPEQSYEWRCRTFLDSSDAKREKRQITSLTEICQWDTYVWYVTPFDNTKPSLRTEFFGGWFRVSPVGWIMTWIHYRSQTSTP